MPTYQYRCTSCGRDLEVVQKFSDATLTVCPTCQGALRKVFNAVGVVFKGSGFYRTDSRTAAESAGGAKADKGAEKQESGEKKSETKVDSGSGKDVKAGTNGSGSSSTSGGSSSSGSSSSGSSSSGSGSGNAGSSSSSTGAKTSSN